MEKYLHLTYNNFPGELKPGTIQRSGRQRFWLKAELYPLFTTPMMGQRKLGVLYGFSTTMFLKKQKKFKTRYSSWKQVKQELKKTRIFSTFLLLYHLIQRLVLKFFVENFDAYLQAKNSSIPYIFRQILQKILQTCYFGYFGHDWPSTLKILV